MKKYIPSYATLLGEYTGILDGLIMFHADKFPEDVLENFKRIRERLESITVDDIIEMENKIKNGNN